VSPTVLAVLCLALMIGLMFLRMPIAFAMLTVGFGGAAYFSGVPSALQLLASDVYRQFSSYSMAVVPLFIFMGQIIFNTGMSTKLFDAAYKWIGSFRGGVAATTIAASIAFSSVSGSNAAATATMGSVALPEMKRYNYDRRLAGGSVAIGGTLGILIPPSTALIIIAVQSEQSIATLFKAALAPGLLVGVLLLATAFVIAWRRPELGPAGTKSTWPERFRSLGGVVEVVILFLFAIVGMFVGLFTPTEAAGVGAAGAVIIALVTRQLTWERFWKSIIETLRTSAFVVLLVAGAIVFGRFLALTRLPFDLAEWVSELPVAPTVILLVVIAIYLVGGALMDALGFLVISIPIFFPLMTALGYDLVWTTIIVTLVTTIGAVTPPVGVNVFIVSGLDKSYDVVTVFRGVMPFYIPYALAIALFIIVPEMILFAV
jgi:tripartite ATP-independent transporter DctM subunit